MCHGFMASRQIYNSMMLKWTTPNTANGMDLLYTSVLQQSWKQVQENSKISLNKICSNWFNHCQIVPECIGIVNNFIDSDQCIKLSDHASLCKLLDALWDNQCIKMNSQKKSDAWSFESFESWSMKKMNLSTKEYQNIKQSEMYKKYVGPNTESISFKEFKKLNFIKNLYVDDKDKSMQQIFQIVEILGLSDNEYKFDGVLMKTQNFSYRAHKYHPGGPPQASGKGKAVVFTLKNGEDSKYYVIQTKQVQIIGI